MTCANRLSAAFYTVDYCEFNPITSSRPTRNSAGSHLTRVVTLSHSFILVCRVLVFLFTASVPQVSILGPLAVTAYTKDTTDLLNIETITFHADD